MQKLMDKKAKKDQFEKRRAEALQKDVESKKQAPESGDDMSDSEEDVPIAATSDKKALAKDDGSDSSDDHKVSAYKKNKLIKDGDDDVEALRAIIMKEHLQKKENALKAKENPGSIVKSRKAEKRKAWKQGKRKPYMMK